MEKFKSKLSSTFSVKLLGQIEAFFGRNINITNRFIELQKGICARKHLQEYVIESANSVRTQFPSALVQRTRRRIKSNFS